MVVAPLRVLVPEPVENVPAPFWTKFLPEAMPTSPFRDTAPVPVWNVPEEADWLKLPVAPAKVMFWPLATEIPPLAFIWPVTVKV